MPRDILERRYDGPIPAADPAHPPASARARAHLFERLASEIRRELVQRRLMYGPSDERLKSMTRTLGLYREHGVAWR